MTEPAGQWAVRGLAQLFPLQLEDLKAGTELCHPLPQLPLLETCQKIVSQENQELHGALGKNEEC